MSAFCRCPACIDEFYHDVLDYEAIVQIIDADVDRILMEGA